MVDSVARDLRFTLRNMGRSPGLAIVIALSLALGIGANTAIFSLIHAVMMKSLPVQDPERLVLMHWYGDSWPRGLNQSGSGGPNNPAYKSASRSLAYPFFQAVRNETDLFDAVFASAPLGSERQNVTLAADGVGGERVDGEMVSGESFRGLGVSPALGRLITIDDERGAAPVAVISHACWTRRFGADPGVVGQAITVNHVPFTIVGVTPPAFFGVQPGRSPDVYVPMLNLMELVPWGFRPADTPSLLEARGYWWAQVIARLKPGVDERRARATVDGLFQQFVPDALPEVDRKNPPHIGFEAGGAGLDQLRGAYRDPLYLMMGMVGLVLLIACANVAVLLLARAMSRRREFALRLSLGAGRARLIRQLLTESLLMAAAGGVLGVVCAGWTSRGLMLLVPPDRRPLLTSQVDLTTLGFAAAISAATAILFGLAPAILATRVDLLPAMKQAGSGAVSSGASRDPGLVHRVRGGADRAVAGAAGRRDALREEPGQSPAAVTRGGRPAAAGLRRGRVAERLHRRSAVQPVPGTDQAAGRDPRRRIGQRGTAAAVLGLGQQRQHQHPRPRSQSVDEPEHQRGRPGLRAHHRHAGDCRPRHRLGRHRRQAPRRRRHRGDGALLLRRGQRRRRRYSPGSPYDASADYEIVGVVSNAKYSQVRGAFPRTAYVPFTSSRGVLRGLYFHVRAAGDPIALANSARSVVQGLDPALAIVEMDSMTNQIGESLWQEHLFARLTTAFSGLALALACIGLYGTISYGVGRRRSEIAVRMALGARYSQVLWMILRQAVMLGIAGVAVGVPLSLWASKYVSSLLFGLTPRDPLTLALTALMLITVVSVAGFLPARRAALVDPARALKQD